ncbi:MASE3 domain-containing protein [Desulfallas thermosapovorans]|uniref:Circadian input-output histidine kinase CikA n=1 Tax=Desulfallas thermosapovorans DSM 6562 TaxID=1121431 RepID=A0A5S4ZW90_9FIRM|nr:MASE3 domain-containing protein [Desulfallas thermosapovorans]TYO97288.1 signal transduction histidine kinase [Desulfallas thermosapovorans DSM 6562]
MVLEPDIFLTAHMILEFASIVAAMLVCIFCWYDYLYQWQRKMLVIALTFLIFGVFDFVHTLSYVSMPDFITPNTANKASTYWVIARMVQGLGILAAVFLPNQVIRIKKPLVIMALALLASGMVTWLVAVKLAHLPIMYDPHAMRQTPLKLALECVIIVFYLLAAFKIYTTRSNDIRDVYLFYALLVGIMGELAFVTYTNVYDLYNLMGHFFKIISFSLILKGLFDESIGELYKTNAELVRQSGELAEANRLLKESEQFKDFFLANTNHELRSPLTAIIAFTELLSDKETGPLNPLQRDYLNEISDSSHDLLNRVNEIAELSRIKAGKLVLNLEKVNLEEVITGVARRLKPQFENKGVDLKLSIAADLPAVRADHGRLGQILTNLMGNAIKFTAPGGWVRVNAALQPEDSKISVSVADNGIGIDLEEQVAVFKMFYQVDGTSSRKYGGTGIGLTLVKNLVEMHGGTITLQSNVGRGSLFTFTIPLYNDESKAAN